MIQGMSLRRVGKQLQRCWAPASGSCCPGCWRCCSTLVMAADDHCADLYRRKPPWCATMGFAAIFITPLTLLLAGSGDAGCMKLSQCADPERALSIPLLGCLGGALAGGVCLRQPTLSRAGHSSAVATPADAATATPGHRLLQLTKPSAARLARCKPHTLFSAGIRDIGAYSPNWHEDDDGCTQPAKAANAGRGDPTTQAVRIRPFPQRSLDEASALPLVRGV